MKEIKLFEKELAMIRESKNVRETFTEPELRVLSAYKNTKELYTAELIVFDESIWSENYLGVLNYLRNANVEEIILAHKSTELLEIIFYFLNNGCTIKKTIMFEYKEKMSWHKTEIGLVLTI